MHKLLPRSSGMCLHLCKHCHIQDWAHCPLKDCSPSPYSLSPAPPQATADHQINLHFPDFCTWIIQYIFFIFTYVLIDIVGKNHSDTVLQIQLLFKRLYFLFFFQFLVHKLTGQRFSHTLSALSHALPPPFSTSPTKWYICYLWPYIDTS